MGERREGEGERNREEERREEGKREGDGNNIKMVKVTMVHVLVNAKLQKNLRIYIIHM